jgi:hypothetical protein
VNQQYLHLKPQTYSYLCQKAAAWWDGSTDAIQRYTDFIEPVTTSPVEVEGLFNMVTHGVVPGMGYGSKLKVIRRNVEQVFGPEFTPEQEAEFAALFEPIAD